MAMKLKRRDPETPSKASKPTTSNPLSRVVAPFVRVAGPESKFRRLIRETRSELRKVVWPTRDQAVHLTILVIAVSIAVGAFLGGIDFLFARLIEVFVGRV
jgi:preprotein translocase subunit SecE